MAVPNQITCRFSGMYNNLEKFIGATYRFEKDF